MTRLTRAFVALAALLAACSRPSASSGEAANGSAAVAAPKPAATPPASVSGAPGPSAVSSETLPSTSPALAASVGDEGAAPKGTPSPATETEANTEVSGCLASASGTPTRAASSAGTPGVELVQGAPPKLVHRLEHACCLHSQTRILRRDRAIQVTEQLSGTPCRCKCSSTLSTELRVPAGSYEISLVLEQGGTRSEVYRGALDVAASSGGSVASPTTAGSQLPRTIHVPAAKH